MENNVISIVNLDALQRNNFPVSRAAENLKMTNILLDQRKLFHLSGVGYWQKDKSAAHLSRNSESAGSQLEDLLIGLYSRQAGFAFLLEGGLQGVSVYVGVWNTAGQQTEEKTLLSMLQGLFPFVKIEPAYEKSLIRYPRTGFALGVPTLKAKEKHGQGSEIDRLVRGMSGENWACLLLAEPIPETNINALRNAVMNDIRQVEASVRSSGSSTPLADLYLQHLKAQLGDLTAGLALGSWRTAAYLMGSDSGYPRLAALWRGTFSGSESIREPTRCFESEPVSRWAVKWALPEEPGTSYHHPNLFQTWLTSTQLAAFAQFPQNETLGFAVRAVPKFDVVPAAPRTARTIGIGKVKEILRPTAIDYAVDVDSLTRHALVAGVTGSGKTNTLFHLLTQLNSQSIPFLILEPSKAEYRALLSNPKAAPSLRVYTPGEERVSPLRLNPFEVVGWPRNSVGVHIDLLRSVFVASFGMWTPLPQILEQCLHAIYEDRGWDITTNTNHRLEDDKDSSLAFPTLTELSIKIDEYTRQLGYDDKVTADLRAALLTRVNGLRIGGKGWMFDSQHSTSMRSLLSQSSIMELQNIGDDDDKAFFMGLLLIQLVEQRRADGDSHNQLRHLLVIEEAHRLLSNVPARSSEKQANPRGKAVETFANLLSEIRAYGQGVVIIDQVPVKLSSDAVKNTNLKIIHRIVSAEDRQTLAGSMAMPKEQSISFSTLTLGEGGCFSGR